VDLRGAKVLLTGAAGGIGQQLAAALAARGGDMVLTGRRTDLLEPLAKKLGGRAIAADLTDQDAIKELMAAAGEIDVLIANAALPATGLLTDYSVAEIDRALDVNLRAPIVMAKLAAQRMVARRRGHLVFSLSGKTASGQASLYNATKFGMRGFALALREFHHARGQHSYGSPRCPRARANKRQQSPSVKSFVAQRMIALFADGVCTGMQILA